MKLPISIAEMNGDVTMYASVHEAEMSMEPIDVEQGEYIATDADGNRLSIEVIIGEVPLLWGLWKTRSKRVRITDSNEPDQKDRSN